MTNINTDHQFYYEPNEDESLLRLVKLFSGSDIDAISDWLTKAIFEKESAERLSFKEIFIKLRNEVNFLKSQSTAKFAKQKANLNKVFESLNLRNTLSSKNYNYVTDCLDRNDFDKFLRFFEMDFDEIELQRENKRDEYKLKLLSNHEFLLQEMIGVLTNEYQTRVRKAKSRIEEYVEPHQVLYQRALDDLAKIETALSNLKGDEDIDEEDRLKLYQAFSEKRIEFEKMIEKERAQIDAVRILASVIKDSSQTFHNLIEKLRKKLRSAEQRKGYVQLLTDMNTELPHLASVFDSMFETFRYDIKALQRSFVVFDNKFQSKILESIDHQGTINRIFFAGVDVVETEIDLTEIKSNQSINHSNPPPAIDYNFDLAFSDVE
jgi:hypothetical protein